MLLTPEQEQKLVEENMPKIYRAVDNFTSRHSSDVARVPYDEFVQEVAIAFLLYIRKCDSPEDINRFPWFSAMNAMRHAVLVYQPMSCPKSSHRFREIMHEMPSTVSMDVLVSSTAEINGLSKRWVDDQDTMVDFDLFMDGYDENTRRIASMRYGGMTLKDIADQCGIDKSNVLRRIQHLAEDYHDFSEDPDKKGASNAK